MYIAFGSRRAFSLIELIIVIAILSLLIGMILVAIHKVRENALHVQNKNNLRQIILGVHSIASDKDGKILKLIGSNTQGLGATRMDASIFVRLIPYVHGKVTMPTEVDTEKYLDFVSPRVAVYKNPADPSFDYDPIAINNRGKCSYAFNMLALDGSLDLISSIPDGTSQTIAIGDKYYSLCSLNFSVATTYNNYTHLFDPRNEEIYGNRRPTFADKGWRDVLPVTDPATGLTIPSVRGKTFQVRPRPEDVDHHILQTAFQSGLTVAMFDGSVRTIAPSVDEVTYWSLVTPAGRESFGQE